MLLSVRRFAATAFAISVFAVFFGTNPKNASAQNLAMAVGGNITSTDPHFHNFAPNNSTAMHFFDRLVHFDAQQRPIPGLAESWRAIDDTTWEFTLRRGVKFHDGREFDVGDVLATFKRVPLAPNSPSSFASAVRGIEAVAVDTYTLRLRTAAPRPLLPLEMATLNIIDRRNAEAMTADFNLGKAMNGTGPFKFKEFAPGDRVTMERNDAYWGEKPAWESVTKRVIVNASARTAALLSGSVQIIDQVQNVDLPRIRQSANHDVETIVSNRLIYLHIDQHRDGTPFVVDKTTGRNLERNPLKDRRVREAMSRAINRQGIVDNIFGGYAMPAGGLVPDGFFGASPKLRPVAFDPVTSQRLLREAGFPDGFGLTIHGPNDRYPEDEKVLQAIGAMFTRVGIDTSVRALPWASYASQSNAPTYAFSMMLVGWGSDTGEASSPLRVLLATHNPSIGFGASNRGRFSNATVDDLLMQALRTIEPDAREKMLFAASELALENHAILPLYYQINLWGTHKSVVYETRTDEYTLANFVKPR